MRIEPRVDLTRAIALALVLGSVLGSATAQTTHGQRPQHERASQSDAELAWQSFLGAGHLAPALHLAQTMVARHPHSALWHRRLGSVAEQQGNAVLAAHAYGWLVEHAGDYALLPRALALAIGSQQDGVAIRLMHLRVQRAPDDQAAWRALIGAMLNADRMRQALYLVQRADRQRPRRFLLVEQAYILHEMGHPLQRQRVLERIVQRYGPDPETCLQLATLQYVQGDLSAALATLKPAMAKADAQQTVYWQTLGALAWTLQDFDLARHASEVLVRSGEATAPDYLRLYDLDIATRPAVAWNIAYPGWRKTHALPLFFDAMNAAQSLHDLRRLHALFASVGAQDRLALEARPDFWIGASVLAYWENDARAARLYYARALQLAPGDQSALTGYFWLLLDTHDTAALARIVDRMGPGVPSDAHLRFALAAALAMLHRPSRALTQLQAAAATLPDSSHRLVDYAQFQSQSDARDAAYATMRQAARMPEHADVGVDAQTLARRQRADRLAELMMLRPGDPARRAVRALLGSGQPQGEQERAQVLSWSFDLGSPEASALWLHRAYAQGTAPPWARLTQALASDDGDQMQRLLWSQSSRLPRRDRVSAAAQLGWSQQAITLAWQGLEDEPADRRLERQFQSQAITSSDFVGAGPLWQSFSGITTIALGVQARHWLTPSWSMDLDAARTRQLREDAQQIGQVPGHASSALLTLTRHTRRGSFGARIGGGHDWRGYTRLGAFYDYQWLRSLQVGVAADYGAPAADSAPLLIGALSDRVRVSGNYQWTARDSLSAALSVGDLRAQGGGHLADRQSLQLDYGHRVWFADPEIDLHLSGSVVRFQSAESVPAQLRLLVPAGQAVTIGFFVPRDYAQACAGIGYNRGAAAADWNDRLHLFGSVDLCRNSLEGAGAQATFGMTTPLFGPDRLRLGIEYADDTGATATRTLGIGLTYRYYFAP